MNSQKKQNARLLTNVLVYLVSFALCIWLVPKFIVFFMPFVIGWIISCIANPVVCFLEKKLKIKRKAGTVVVIVLVIGIVAGLGYEIIALLVRQIAGFIREIPALWASVEAVFSNLGDIGEKFFSDLPADWRESLDAVGNFIGEALVSFSDKVQASSAESVGSVGNMVGNIANVIISVIMALLSSYFFIAEREEISQYLQKKAPETLKNKVELFQRSFTTAVGGYFKAQFKIEIWIYLLILIGLTLMQVNYAFLFALLIAALDFLPVFGTGTVLWPWAVLRLLSGDYIHAIGFVVMWGVGQLVRQFIQPKIMGDSIGVAPLPTLFLLFIGYRLAGVLGMIISIPVGIILINMYDAGWFESLIVSVKLLLKNLNDYRKITSEDRKAIEKTDEKAE